MGVTCSENRKRKIKIELKPEEIVKEINKFFENMKVRSSKVSEVADKVLARIVSTQETNLEEWKNFLKEEIKNIDYEQESKDLANNAMEEGKLSNGSQSFPLLSLLFLAESNSVDFITSFKAINLANKTKEAGNNIANVVNVVNKGVTGGLLSGIVSGLGAIQNVAGAVNQVSNPNIIRKYDLKNLILYYINFISLLPVSILKEKKEGKLEECYFTILANSFDKNIQKKYVDDIFKNYNEEINLDEFFGENLLTLKDYKKIRHDFVAQYLKSLTKEEINKIIAQ